MEMNNLARTGSRKRGRRHHVTAQICKARASDLMHAKFEENIWLENTEVEDR